jgi:hypothetical protein
MFINYIPDLPIITNCSDLSTDQKLQLDLYNIHAEQFIVDIVTLI